MANEHATIYTLDTDVLVHAMNTYPLDISPDIWEHIGNMLSDGRILICDPVYQEIQEQEDDLSAWLKVNINGSHIEEPSAEDFAFVQDVIMQHYEERYSNWFHLEDPNGLDADPFLVATAATRNLTVVTFEQRKIMQKDTPISKVPNVCDLLNIRCIGNEKDKKQSPILDFLRDSEFTAK
jgi:hypothetical protein